MAEVQSGNLCIRQMFKKSGMSGKTCLVLSTWFGSGQSVHAPAFAGKWIQYRLALGATNGVSSPRIAEVRIYTHRELGPTTCPGRNLQPRVNAMRQAHQFA